MGTRLCAYWSQQYRCLYPGRAIDTEQAEDGTTITANAANATSPDFVSVEFDDGDSGRIRLQNIRLLLSDYPIAGLCLFRSFVGETCSCLRQLSYH